MANISQEAQDELLLLESMYPDRFHWIHPPAATDLPCFQLSLDPLFNDGLEHHVEMRVTIGAEYPGTRGPRITLEMPEMGREDVERFRSEYSARLLSAHHDHEEGSVCVDVGVATLLDLAAHFSPRSPRPNPRPSSPIHDPLHNPSSPPDATLSMAWSVFWMHHIKATGKRKDIVGWARELHIRGWSKPGYPGAVVIDGPKAAVEEYCSRLKALRWKAIQQRHFQLYHIPLLDHHQRPELSEPHRRIRLDPTRPPVDEVVEVQSMAQLLQLAAPSGLQDLLLQILKIK